MSLPTAPDWLSLRDGSLKPGIRDHILFVMVGDQPQYKLEARPAAGQFTCAVTQTINGKRVDGGAKYPTRDAALSGGLDELRAALGW
ncbi:MAG: hypothetical protein U0871_19270 [Gemmataceae bacterium]